MSISEEKKTNLDPEQDPKEKNCFSDLYKSAENSFYGFKVELLLFKKVLYLRIISAISLRFSDSWVGEGGGGYLHKRKPNVMLLLLNVGTIVHIIM